MTSAKKNSNLLVFFICLGSSLVPFMGSALNLALPDLISHLSLNAVETGWIQSSYMLSTAIFQIPCAKLADMLGRKKIFIAGILIFIACSLLCSFSTTGAAFITSRFFMGIGSAMMFGTSMAILIAHIDAKKRGKVLGINSAVVYFSLAAGPLLGGILTQHFGWQSIFYVSILISLVVLIGSFIYVQEDWKMKTAQTFDFIGSGLYALSLTGIIYGFSILPHWTGFFLLATGALLLIFFGLYEKRQAYPVFNIRLFLGNKVFKMSTISALINYSATFAISFMMSLYLQYIRGFTPGKAGLILIIQAVIQALVSLKSGSMSDKRSPAMLATLGMGIISASLLCLAFIDESTSIIFIGILLAVLGFGFGMFSSPNTNIIMSSVEKKDYSMASATTGTMRLTGQSLSMAIAMMAIAITVGDVKITPDVHSQLMNATKITFISCTILCLIGTYTSSIRNKKEATIA